MSADLDPAFRYALKLLHSSSVDSTEKIRNSLDDLIKQRHGTSKMLANTLSKKYLAEECSAPGVVQRHRSSDSKASSSNSPQQITVTTADSNSVVTTPIVVPDDDDDDDLMEEAHLQEFQDLNCVVCRRIESSAKNRLIECTDCQSLYHQECHSPQISESDANENDSTWCCSHCKNKVKSSSVASPAKSSCSTSSSSSSSYHKHVSKYEPSAAAAVTSKSSSSSSSSKSSSKHKSSSSKHSSKSSSSSQSIVSPSNGSSSGTNSLTKAPVTINIISADKRLQNMKKKAAKMQETRRKHK
ncbi:integrator complex subunit 12-like [Bradysia coprophila]|uniref:integrator complex subunit 12-like n=1 Tax=Bradysia coprophila TaxID=38358 RepID=UPI00187D9B1B|nr:integrator complex subunit 12-like [Bradysia coprophila]